MAVGAGPTGRDYRVVQIHPTLRCNLRCHHCYSASGPDERDALPLDVLIGVLEDLRSEGYNSVGFSGGEPLMYSGLPALLAASKERGMTTTLTTNGMLLSPARLAPLVGLVDVFAVSVDGSEVNHNRIRGSDNAYRAMRRGLGHLRAAGVAFGVIFTLTQTNLDDLRSIVEVAVAEGARLVQVHPMEEVGRAEVDLPLGAPDEEELAYAFLEVARLRSLHGGDLTIHLDVASRPVLRQEPGRGFADGVCETVDVPLADLVAPLVIEADGTVVPIQYGFGRDLAIGNVTEEGLCAAAARWRTTGYPAFSALCKEVYDDQVVDDGRLPFFNWYGALTTASRG